MEPQGGIYVTSEVIKRAYEIAEKYCTAPRRDGSPAMSHIHNVVDILKRMGITEDHIIATAILHDVIEDCHDVDPNDDRAEFEVAKLDKYILDTVKVLT